MRLGRYLSFCGFLLFSQLSSALDAPAALIPPGLNPGDEFYIIFAGSDTLNGAQTAATYSNYAATVKANDPDTNAISGWITLFGHDDSTLVTLSAFSDASKPIYNTNGDKVADNRAEFFSSTQDSAIGYDEQGNANANNIWTGFNFTGGSTGIGDDSLGGNDWLTDGCLAGNPSQTDNRWAASVLLGGAGCAGANLGLYVLSPLLSVPAPVLDVSPVSLDFGGQAVGSVSGDMTATLSNSGTADLQISAIDATVAPFAVSGGTCGAAPITIVAGGNCTVTYTFSPTAVRPASQTLAITSNAPAGSGSVSLQGVGLGPVLSLTPSPLDFGSLVAGSSDDLTVTLSNTGNADLQISAIAASLAPFSVSGGTCGAAPITIGAGGNCTLTFTFSPNAAGAASQSLAISSNASSGPGAVDLQGVGQAAPQQARPVPVLPPYALLLLSLMIITVASVTRRRSV